MKEKAKALRLQQRIKAWEEMRMASSWKVHTKAEERYHQGGWRCPGSRKK